MPLPRMLRCLQCTLLRFAGLTGERERERNSSVRVCGEAMSDLLLPDGKNCTGSSCVSDKMACDAVCERNGMTTLIVLGSFFVMVLAGVLCCLLSQLKTSEQRAQRQTSDILEDGRGSRKVGE